MACATLAVQSWPALSFLSLVYKHPLGWEEPWIRPRVILSARGHCTALLMTGTKSPEYKIKHRLKARISEVSRCFSLQATT